MSKKILAFVGAVMMVGALATACSKSKKAPTTPENTAAPAGGGDATGGGAYGGAGYGTEAPANPCGGAANPCGGN